MAIGEQMQPSWQLVDTYQLSETSRCRGRLRIGPIGHQIKFIPAPKAGDFLNSAWFTRVRNTAQCYGPRSRMDGFGSRRGGLDFGVSSHSFSHTMPKS